MPSPERINTWVWRSIVFMAIVSLITLSKVGPGTSIPYHFDFSAEPGATAPAILVTLFFPLLLWVIRTIVLRSKQSLDLSGYYTLIAVIFIATAAHTFMCVYSC